MYILFFILFHERLHLLLPVVDHLYGRVVDPVPAAELGGVPEGGVWRRAFDVAGHRWFSLG
jgi:hypothetical protein